MNKVEKAKRYLELAEWHDDQAKITRMCSLPNRSDNHAQSATALRRLAEIDSSTLVEVRGIRDAWENGDEHIFQINAASKEEIFDGDILYRLPEHKEQQP